MPKPKSFGRGTDEEEGRVSEQVEEGGGVVKDVGSDESGHIVSEEKKVHEKLPLSSYVSTEFLLNNMSGGVPETAMR